MVERTRHSHPNLSDPELWERLRGYVPGEDGSKSEPDALTFAKRLARENGWTAAYVESVIEEYRRFCYLACIAEAGVTPSEDVDQAWHLHLAYTRDYWGRFCPKVLRRELHHGPTRGGRTEGERYRDQYAGTLAAYAREFGTAPPDLIWPDAEERFQHAAQWQRVNLATHALRPRARMPADWKTLLKPAAALAGCVLFLGLTVASEQNGRIDWPWLVIAVGLFAVALWQIDRATRGQRHSRPTTTAGGCGSAAAHHSGHHSGKGGDSGCGSGCGGGGCSG